MRARCGQLRPYARGLFCAVALCVHASAGASAASTTKCTPVSPPGYAQRVAAVTRSSRDVWGDRLLAAPGGPTYERSRQLLAPLLYATKEKHRPMTSSGVYYLPLAYPTGVKPPLTVALAVADGSEIISRHNTGYSVALDVGPTGDERYGSCLARTQTATLADGYLPIVSTSYTDSAGVSYEQEAFAGRVPGAESIVTLIRLSIDASASSTGSVVRFDTQWPERLLVDEATPLQVAPGATAVVYAAWLNKVPLLHPINLTERLYDRARAAVVDYWNGRLARGATYTVPDEQVMNAQRAILIQQLIHGWRYSVGNLYEELSFAEALDTAVVMGEYGFGDDIEAILRISIDRLRTVPARFTSWRAGALLLAEAAYFELYRNKRFVNRNAAGLAAIVARLASRQIESGPAAGRLQPEPLSSDLHGAVDAFPAQVVAWQGLNAIARVWRATGHRAQARKATALADTLEAALRAVVRDVAVQMPDGSYFVPATLSVRIAPYQRIPATRRGSYWNLVMPYAFASGFFPPNKAAAQGILHYLLNHAGSFLGVVRSDAHVLYGEDPGTGLNQVYGLNVSRFLADNDQPDRLVLSLYGMLAVAMTPDTFVSGEAISATPLGTAHYRTMYMPPNLGANSTFLETLLLTLIHEVRAHGLPIGLDLAFATPRGWLADGGVISVSRARTAMGPLSYSIARDGTKVRIRVAAPRSARVRMRLRLPSDDTLRRITMGTARIPFNAATSTFVIPHGRAPVELVATIAARA